MRLCWFLPFVLSACSYRPPVASKPALRLSEAKQEMLQQRWSNAAYHFDRIAHSAPEGPERWEAACLAAVCRLKYGECRAAADSLRALLKECRDPALVARSRQALAEALRLSGDHSGALGTIQSLRELPSEALDQTLCSDEYLYRLGSARIRAGDRESGCRTLSELLKRYPNSPRTVDAGLRLQFSGFAVRVGFPMSDAEKRIPEVRGVPLSLVQVKIPGQPSQWVAVTRTLRSYQEALRLAEYLARQGFAADPIP